MQRSLLLKLFIQVVIAFSLLLNPTSGYADGPSSAHPKIQTEWVSNQTPKKRVRQIVYSGTTLKDEPTTIPVVLDVAVQLKSAEQQIRAFSKPRTHRQKVPSLEDELIA